MKLEAIRTTDISDISRMSGQASDRELDRVRKTIEMYDRNNVEDLESLIQLGKLRCLSFGLKDLNIVNPVGRIGS